MKAASCVRTRAHVHPDVEASTVRVEHRSSHRCLVAISPWCTRLISLQTRNLKIVRTSAQRPNGGRRVRVGSTSESRLQPGRGRLTNLEPRTRSTATVLSQYTGRQAQSPHQLRVSRIPISIDTNSSSLDFASIGQRTQADDVDGRSVMAIWDLICDMRPLA